jgi:copper chaperone
VERLTFPRWQGLRFDPLNESKESDMHEFKLPDMSCGHCRAAVTEAVKEVDAQAEVTVDLAQKTATVHSGLSREQLASALSEAGYPPAS